MECQDRSQGVRQVRVAVVQGRAAEQGRHAARELAGAAGAGAGGEPHWRLHHGGGAPAKAASAVWGGSTPDIASASRLRGTYFSPLKR